MTEPQLFDTEELVGVTPDARSNDPPTGRVVRVVVDVAAVTGEFDYLVPSRMEATIAIGDIVRVPFGGRRVRGWVVDVDVVPPAGVELASIARRTGCGPPPEVIATCRWAAWRWAGRLPAFLGTASPPAVVRTLGDPPSDADPARRRSTTAAPQASVRRIPPATSLADVLAEATAGGDALVICPDARRVREVIELLRSNGARAVAYPDGWARAARGTTVVGTRVAAFAPMPNLGSVLVIDEHDELLASERSPTWNARAVAAHRAASRGVPLLLASPCPSVDALEMGTPQIPSRAEERAGWAIPRVIETLDEETGRRYLFPSELVSLLRECGPALCVLNRVGRAGLLACDSCASLQRCERCDAGLTQPDDGMLRCPRCAISRPVICQQCGGARMKRLRLGVSRAAEELAALLREPVAEVTAQGQVGSTQTRVSIGTEAVLHRRRSADVVAFLDFDQELLAPRYRAGERALALLATASRIVGPRRSGGTVVVQTTMADHPVVRAWRASDPGILSADERDRRQLLGVPPYRAVAVIGGPGAPPFLQSLPDVPEIERMSSGDDEWLLVAADHATLCDHLAQGTRGAGRLRLAVDPVRL